MTTNKTIGDAAQIALPDTEKAKEMVEEEKEEEMKQESSQKMEQGSSQEMEQGSSLCPLLNMEPHLLDKVLGYLTVYQMAEVSAT